MTAFSIKKQLPVTPTQAWAVLTNAVKLASGPLGITRLEGEVRLGSKLKLWTEATGSRAFVLEVTKLEAGREMVWEGGMPLGLFKGVRRFALTPSGEGTTFEMSETFSGLMAGLITKSIPDLNPSFEKFANGLGELARKES